jgi:hypothetical protein
MRSHAAITWLLRCYPAAWRARYGVEFAALVDECPAGPITVIDMLLALLDAWVHPEETIGGVPVLPKLRTSALVVFCTWVVYVLAGIGFSSVLDDNPLTQLAGSRPKAPRPSVSRLCKPARFWAC